MCKTDDHLGKHSTESTNGEAEFSVTFSQIGCNHDTLIIMWYHTESFGEVKFMVVA